MKTSQNAPFCIKSTKKILGGQTPPDPPPLPGLVACTAKKASYAPDRHHHKFIKYEKRLRKDGNMLGLPINNNQALPRVRSIQPQGLVTIQVNILSMYKHICLCLYIDSIFTWIVTRPFYVYTLIVYLPG